MAGPTPMALGPFAFEALGFSFNGISRDLDTGWADIPVASTMNALQYVGPKSEGLTINGVLFPEAYGGQQNLDGIRQAAQEGTPLMLVTLSGDIRGSHAVMSVSEDRDLHTGFGLPRRNGWSISLRRLGKAQGGSSFSSLNLFF